MSRLNVDDAIARFLANNWTRDWAEHDLVERAFREAWDLAASPAEAVQDLAVYAKAAAHVVAPPEGRERLTPQGFLDAIIELGRANGYSLSHQDGQGAFIVEAFDPIYVEWLRAAETDSVAREGGGDVPAPDSVLPAVGRLNAQVAHYVYGARHAK